MSDALTTCTRGWYLCIEFKIVCNQHGEDGEDDEDGEGAEDAEDAEDKWKNMTCTDSGLVV